MGWVPLVWQPEYMCYSELLVPSVLISSAAQLYHGQIFCFNNIHSYSSGQYLNIY